MRSTRERRVKRNPIYRALENFGEFICLFWFKYVYFKSGIEQRSARLAHNQKVVGSNPTPATSMAFRKDIVWFVVAAILVSAVLQFSSPKIPDMDSFYHFRHASLLPSHGFDTDFPWIRNSVIREYGADLWYGFHLLLIPFTLINNFTFGIKLAGVLITFALLAAYFWTARRHNFSLPALWPFLFLLAVPHSLYMLLMARPHVLSLAAGILLFSFLIKGTWREVGLIGASLTFFHESQFWIGFGLAFLVLGMRIFQKIFIDRSWSLQWDKFAAVFGGMLLGALLRPHPLAGLQLTYIQIFQLFMEKSRLPLLFGKEIAPISFNMTISLSALFFVLWILAIILAVWIFYKFRDQAKKLSADTQLFLAGSGLLSLVFFLMSIFVARRAYTLWVAFGILFVGAVYSFLATRKSYRDVFSAVILITFLIMIPYTLYREAVIFADDAAPPDYLRDAANWLSENSNAGDVVFNTHWDNFAPLFFWNQKNYYIAGIDPIYQYVYDSALYWEFHFISKDEIGDFTCTDPDCSFSGRREIYSALKNDLGVKYILLEKRRNPVFFGVLSADGRFEKKFDNGQEEIFLVE